MILLIRSKAKRVDREEVYLYLTKEYGFTPAEIANMNQYQIYVYYRGSKVVKLATLDEYNAWKLKRG